MKINPIQKMLRSKTPTQCKAAQENHQEGISAEASGTV
jgi:hypothetical protein